MVNEYKWKTMEWEPHEEVKQLAEKLNINVTLAQLLFYRGVNSYESAKKFFRPHYDLLHDPFLMKDMDLAVDRILRAIEDKERILIYGDYDVDGVTSVSVLYLFLKYLRADVDYYIPDRQQEGYGLSRVGIEYAKRRETDLIISVDCGISALEEAELIRGLGMDLVVNDHHEPSEILPRAAAVLDPKRPDCDYPFKQLAAVGVVYKLASAILKTLGQDESHLENYIDLVALGSAADIVPLIDENRILVKYGLEKLNQPIKRVGIHAILSFAGLRNRNFTTGQVIFGIAPRINAAGRLGDAKDAVRLLTTTNKTEANEIAQSIEEINASRREIDRSTFYEAQREVEEHYDLHYDRAIVLDSSEWHVGVIGIVASRIAEKYYRPTVMISTTDGVGKGSARSIQSFNLYHALTKCSDLFVNFGGHEFAAGMTIESRKIDAFRERINDIAKNQLTDDDLIPELKIEGKLSLGEIDEKLIRVLNAFEPFGPENMRPVFSSHNVEVVGIPSIVGDNHLKFKVRQNGYVIDTIGFGLGELKNRLEPGLPSLDLAYQIVENEWRGSKTLQLRIKDLK